MSKVLNARKKPIEVMVLAYNSIDDAKFILNFMIENKNENSNEYAYHNPKESPSIFIVKDRGTVELHLGDYLLWEINTDKVGWAIRPDIFKETYEIVENKKNIARKKSIINECILYDDISDTESVFEFLGFNIKDKETINLILESKLKKRIEIATLEGPLYLYTGEYLMKGIKGEYYPVKKEMFNKVYNIIGEKL